MVCVGWGKEKGSDARQTAKKGAVFASSVSTVVACAEGEEGGLKRSRAGSEQMSECDRGAGDDEGENEGCKAVPWTALASRARSKRRERASRMAKRTVQAGRRALRVEGTSQPEFVWAPNVERRKRGSDATNRSDNTTVCISSPRNLSSAFRENVSNVPKCLLAPCTKRGSHPG
eukprot:915815-Pleurochrysis_carterae.AAC.5